MESPSDATVSIVAGLMIVVGLVGIVVPVLPGLILVWAGVALWAFTLHTTVTWTVLGIASVVMVLGSLVKYIVPGRRMREAGVPWSTLALGSLCGVVGFFVVPVLGLFLGFVLGVYLAERTRLVDNHQAWPSTKAALQAVGISMIIELLSGLIMVGVWAGGVWITARQ